MKGKGSNAVFMHYSKRYGTARYGGYAAPYTPFRRNIVAIVHRHANLLPASRWNSRPAPHTARSPTVSNGILVAH